MRNKTVFALFAVCAFLLLPSANLFAQASLAAENQLSDVTVNINGEKDTYTCIRDGREVTQWYYVPNRPRLATKGKDNLPVFHLLKYQAKDPADKSGKTLVEGGILQFAVKLAAPDGAVDQMKSEIAKLKGIKDPKTVQLGPLPINAAEVTLYAPDGNMLTEGSEPQQPGVAPAFANQEMAFQIKLNKLGADVFEALTTGGGGLPVMVTYTYNGLTPPLGFKIHADWDQTFKHFSSDTKAKADFGCWAWGASVETSVSTVNEETLKKMGVTVTKISGEGMSSSDMQAIIDPILAKIQENIAEDMKPFDKVEPAKANQPNPRRGAFFSGGVSMSFKAENKRKHGTEDWEWTEQMVVERKTSCGTLIGIGHLDKKIQEKLVTIMPAGNWAAAYYSLPAVGDDPSLGIKQIDLTVVPVGPDGKQIKGVKQELGVWKPDNGGDWIDTKTKSPITFLLFPMQGVYDSFKAKPAELDKCKYQVGMKITTQKDVYQLKYLEDMIDGDVPVSTPIDVVEAVVVDASFLSFASKGDKDGLAVLQGVVKSKFPAKSYTFTIKGDSPNLTPAFLVEKETQENRDPNRGPVAPAKVNPVKVELTFKVLKDGKAKDYKWKYNTLPDIRKEYPGLNIFLVDGDTDGQ